MIHISVDLQVNSNPHMPPHPPPPPPPLPEIIPIMLNSVHANMVMDDGMMAFSSFSTTPTNTAHIRASHLSYTYCAMRNIEDINNSKKCPLHLFQCV